MFIFLIILSITSVYNLSSARDSSIKSNSINAKNSSDQGLEKKERKVSRFKTIRKEKPPVIIYHAPYNGKHTFDLAKNMPKNFVIMDDLNWFGIPSYDLLEGLVPAPGPDQYYGLWRVGSAISEWSIDLPLIYPITPYGEHFPAVCSNFKGSKKRYIASNYRPISGIYSSSGSGLESYKKRKLDLNMIRRNDDPKARVTTLMLDVGHLKGTEKYGLSPGQLNFKSGEDIRYRGLLNTLKAADELGLQNSVSIQYMSTGLFLFYPEYPSNEERKVQAAEDLVDYVNILKQHQSALRINNKLVLFFHITNFDTFTLKDWSDVLHSTREKTNHDFYTVFYSKSGERFEYADALHPFISYVEYTMTSGMFDFDHAMNWKLLAHKKLFEKVVNYDGRVVIGAISPGFDDWTKQWGDGVDRQIPRSKEVISGQIRAFKELRNQGKEVGGFMLSTWNDYTEGHQWEPDSEDQGQLLGYLSEKIGSYNKEIIDPLETQRLRQAWINHGIKRTCPN